MRRKKQSNTDKQWLVKLGKHVEELIEKRGYKSPYDFWINKAGDDLSRSALNYIVTGKTDVKATTLRALAKLLDVKPSTLLDF